MTITLPDGSAACYEFEDALGRHALWHSSAHLLAAALKALYPSIKFGTGPAIDSGFYYDVDARITDADLPAIERTMLEMARSPQEFVRKEISKADALAYFEQQGQAFKCQLIADLTDGTITTFTNGEFTDLCKGPHLLNTKHIKAVKLTAIAGAYWRNDDRNPMLTRIYGIAFPKQSMLAAHLQMLEEARLRDHRKIGRELELFAFSDKVGAGLPLWLPRGAALRLRLQEFLAAVQAKHGYQQVMTPHIGHKDLYVTSGHYAKYGEDSFKPIATPNKGEEFLLKPMNCPHHCEIFRFKPRSYRDLPLRLAEFGTVYRYEQSGELHGLTRVRGFTQDDAHIFCTGEQLKAEFKQVIDIIMYIFATFKFTDYTAQISLRSKDADDSKYIGSAENWERAERAIVEAVSEQGMAAEVVEGEAAFYGPKLDFMVRDAIGRKWQLGTIQVDYNLPDRFELEYTAADGSRQRPVMLHRAPFGSLERFTAVLIEHTAGKFPLWLAPDQAIVLPVSDRFNDYAQQVCDTLNTKQGLRCAIDLRSEKIGRKIRDAELLHIPYLLIVGEREQAAGTLAVRRQGEGEGGAMPLDAFAQAVRDEVGEALGQG